ncbi:MAG: alpha-L-fucosidase [Christensenellaceae bacterium]|jgi:alpha-L-fucosidase|nr:alpha-L-fucosidase [Christensenellaceae bacterium]
MEETKKKNPKLKKYILVALVVLLSLAIVTVGSLFLYLTYKYNIYEVVSTKYSSANESFSRGFGTDNNGYAKDGEEIAFLNSVYPTEQQKSLLDTEYYGFVNFGMSSISRTLTSDGKEDPKSFNPQNVSTEQWCKSLNAAGAKGAILNVKAADGFCLWSTDTTAHSIKNSSYKNGNGDILSEFVTSADGFNLKLGIFYSLYDMNASFYGTEQYNDYVAAQLQELVVKERTGSEIFYFLFDDTYGENIEPGFKYDYERFIGIIGEQQRYALVSFKNYSNLVHAVGDSVDSVGDEVWCVVDSQNLNGSNNTRTALAGKTLTFSVPEVSVNLRKGDYYSAYEKPKALYVLKQLYFKTVGYNANLMLKISPMPSGQLDPKDEKRLEELGVEIDRTLRANVRPIKVHIGNAIDLREHTELSGLVSDSDTTQYIFPSYSAYIVEFLFTYKTKFGRIDLREYFSTTQSPSTETYSQRIEAYEIWIDNNGVWKLVADRNTVGNRSIVLLRNPPSTYKVRVVIKQARGIPAIRSIVFYSKI